MLITMKDLKLFIQPGILQRIGARRLGKLLRPFAAELQAINFPMPPPDEPDRNDYFHTLAAAIARTDSLPKSVLKTLLTLETAAAPESSAALEDAIHRRIPNVCLPRGFIIDHALEVWIVAPEELARFAPADKKCKVQSEEGKVNGNTAECRVQNSAVEDDPPSLRFGAAREENEDEEENGNSTSPAEPAASTSPAAEMENQNSKIENSSIQESTHPPIQSEFTGLARLSPVEYDQVRRAEAKRLHLRLRTLDKAVDDARSLLDDAEANDVLLSPTEPWPEPITDAPALFDEVHDRSQVYLYLPPGAAVVLTLWPGHAHAINAFTHTPRLNLTSAQPGCGKSTVLDFLAPLCPRVLHTNNLKPAVLYRVMHRGQLTVFLDELDTYLQIYPELRGLLNASNKPTSSVHRCEGNAVRVFKIYAATALAGLGHLTPTLRHRSIIITLEEAPPGVLKTRFNPHHIETEIVLGRKIARWAKDNFDAIAACDPVLPPKAHNRLADNWRPLFALAQVIGGHWPERTVEAFNQLTAKAAPAADQGLELLADMGIPRSSKVWTRTL